MSSILIKNVILDGVSTDVFIENNLIKTIGKSLNVVAEKVIECNGTMAITPPFYNTHNHGAMTLLRGYADDLELFDWLSNYIWPAEAKLTGDDIYHGSRLAILEMIRSGTVFFNDMYWHQLDTIKAVEEMGVRAAIGALFITGTDGEVLERNRQNNMELIANRKNFSDRIEITLAPHAIYTVAKPILEEIAHMAKAEDLYVHIHASETMREVEDSMEAHNLSPIAYLDSLNLLTPKTILAHCVHISDADIELIKERQAVIAHMPCSNMKLVSGQFPYHKAADIAKCRVTIGTDGASSNNNLSMLDEMKFAALSAKIESKNPTAAKDTDIFKAATQVGAEAFGINGGVIAESKVADCLLIKLNHPQMVGNYSLISNLVYSGDSSVIDTVICDGKILMEHNHVENEEEIIAKAQECCKKILAF